MGHRARDGDKRAFRGLSFGKGSEVFTLADIVARKVVEQELPAGGIAKAFGQRLGHFARQNLR